MKYIQTDKVDLNINISMVDKSDINPLSLLDEEYGLVADWNNLPPYYDEPRMFHFIGRLPAVLEMEEEDQQWLDETNAVVTAGGCSFDKTKALWKLVGEAVEREALIFRENLPIKYDSYEKLDEPAIDPNTIPAGKGFDHDDRRAMCMGWVSGRNLYNQESIWIPAQLIYVPYFYQDGEAIIRSPMSTGAAAANSLENALYCGLSEIVERDAFMVAWLKQLPLKYLPFSMVSDSTEPGRLIHKTKASMERYRLKPSLFVLPTDVTSNVVMCVLEDKSGIGPAISIGAKASWSMESAVIGALEEAQQLRPWLRSMLENDGVHTIERKSMDKIGLDERARLWLSEVAVKSASGWLSNASELTEMPSDQPSKLITLLQSIENAGGNCYFVNLTTKKLENIGLYVVKALVPEFQPLYLDEQYADFVLQRLDGCENRLGAIPRRKQGAVEPFPHPFL
jgi:ribosomal protein S12 methylthiotransferase accessory factor